MVSDDNWVNIVAIWSMWTMRDESQHQLYFHTCVASIFEVYFMMRRAARAWTHEATSVFQFLSWQ